MVKPTIGRIVIFTAAADLYQGLDGAHAAIVNGVNTDGTVNLSVLSGSEKFPVHVIKHVSFNENAPAGTWKWPETPMTFVGGALPPAGAPGTK